MANPRSLLHVVRALRELNLFDLPQGRDAGPAKHSGPFWRGVMDAALLPYRVTPFLPDDRVTTGEVPGTVVALFPNKAGELHYVVEDDGNGALHILTAKGIRMQDGFERRPGGVL